LAADFGKSKKGQPVESDRERALTVFESQFGTANILSFDIRKCAYAALEKVLYSVCRVRFEPQQAFVNELSGSPPILASNPDIYAAVIVLRHEASSGVIIPIRKGMLEAKGSGFVSVKIPMAEIRKIVKLGNDETSFLANCQELFVQFRETLRGELEKDGLGAIQATSFKVFPKGMTVLLKDVDAQVKHVVNVFRHGNYLLCLEAGFFSHFEFK